MVISSKLSDSLKTIGLNKYERNLWVALLARGSASAGELADISKVPRSRCYDVLESLADRGFVVVQPGKPIRYVAINPRESLERAKKKVHENARETTDKIDRMLKTDAIRDLEKVHKDGLQVVMPEEISGSLRGRHANIQQTETMLKKAKKYVKILTTENGLNDLVENHDSQLKKAAKSGVKLYIAAPIGKRNDETIKTLAKYAQLRDIQDHPHVKRLIGKMCVVDGEEFLLGLTEEGKAHPTQEVAFWTQSRHASAGVFEPMFDMIWNTAKQVK